MPLPRCGICSRRCVPLADYDAPTCIDCDLVAEAVLTRVQLTATAFPKGRRRGRRPVSPVLPLELNRPPETYYGPAAPGVIAELLDVLLPTAGQRAGGQVGGRAAALSMPRRDGRFTSRIDQELTS